MSWVATAVVGSAAIGAGAAYLAGKEQADAARDAAAKSAESARYQADIQRQIYEQTRADQTPWREAGVDALNQLRGLTGPDGELLRSFSMADFEADPGYEFRKAEGMKAIERSAASRGGVLSGGAMRGIQRYGQNLASDEYGRAFDRFQTGQTNRFNRLASVAGVGQTANAALGQAGSNYGNAITSISLADATNQGNAILAGGNARASGYLGMGNAVGNALAAYPYGSYGYRPGGR